MVKQLTPLLNQPGLISTTTTVTKVPAPVLEKPVPGALGDMMMMSAGNAADHVNASDGAGAATDAGFTKVTTAKSNMVILVTGFIIGSPEFQRR